ncbi:MAG: aspartate aminotransferase family protein [Bradyrhizobium sp.]|uniref:aspartate aminotransferase family protein n=1 Tax=Bradyrhizobium sp. TaxID=376 RepID=UPI00120E0B88|nr:aspartate aminotransferase family protein [Bradyrhizobium sp.]THD72502.1 MAG: aspartate aminotransferase family protein [Bradyrhizobium sp.]
MTHVLHRQINHSYPVAESAKGIYIRDTAGRDYIDASGGAAVSCLGHSHPDILAAMRAQLDRLEYAHTSFFTSQAAEELADDLVAHAPEGLDHAFFVSGGSEAIEAALKLARQYFVERGEPQRRFLIARRQSYHGVTLGALATGGREWQRRQFAPLLIDTHHVSPVYQYRDRRSDETPEAYGKRLAAELGSKIEELGGENVIAFVAETVVGATLGAVPAVPGYFRRVRDICDRHGILLILDEVMCGIGRTGTLHACEQEGVSPDILAIAKGLGGGYAPIGAILLHRKIFETIAKGSGAFQHSHTYTGHPLACAAALAVQRVIRRDNLLANVRQQGGHLARRLQERFGNHPFVGDVRGRGLFQGLEIVADRGTKKPFDPQRKLHAQIKREAMARGLMVYPMGGTVDGTQGDHVLLAPPFIIDSEAIDTIVERLGDAIDAAVGA